MNEADLFHITRARDWETARARGSYQADSLASEGFIHCSTRSQVIATADRFYRGQAGLVLLAIDSRRLTSAVRWENLEGGKDAFPHIYGPLNLEAIVEILEFNPGEDGLFNLL